MLDEMRAGVIQAWCRGRSNWCWLILMLCIGGGGCGQRSLDVASKAEESLDVLQRSKGWLQPFIIHQPHHECIAAVVPIIPITCWPRPTADNTKCAPYATCELYVEVA
jgi:hypothetical protein